MDYTIRPVEPGDAPGIAALRRMPGVFENTLGLPSCRTADSAAFLASLGPNDSRSVPIPGCATWAASGCSCIRTTKTRG